MTVKQQQPLSQTTVSHAALLHGCSGCAGSDVLLCSYWSLLLPHYSEDLFGLKLRDKIKKSNSKIYIRLIVLVHFCRSFKGQSEPLKYSCPVGHLF